VCREGWSAGVLPIGNAIVTLTGFAAGLALTLAGSELLARGLTRLGTKLEFSEGLLGLLAALGADSPELSSAVIAILAGAGDVGVGVVVGSNLFNLAALLGLSAIVAGGVRVRRGPLILDAAVGLGVMLAAALMVAGLASPTSVAVIVLPLIAAYALVLALPRSWLAHLNPLLGGVPQSLIEVPYEVAHDRPIITHRSWTPVLLLPIALVGVVGGSYAMVHAALASQSLLHLSSAVLGTVVLAALTSLPNLWLALHFARTNRGTALMSAAMNSNTINLLGGLVVPALFIGAGFARGSFAYFGWLLDLTLLAVLAPLPRRRLSRAAGVAIIAIYLVFAGLRVAGI
jgi:cation:H+ antiporter